MKNKRILLTFLGMLLLNIVVQYVLNEEPVRLTGKFFFGCSVGAAVGTLVVVLLTRVAKPKTK